jgi:hypothetical protein
VSAPNISTTVTSTGTDPDGWRRWWAAEAVRTGTNWRSLLIFHFEISDRLRASSSWGHSS